MIWLYIDSARAIFRGEISPKFVIIEFEFPESPVRRSKIRYFLGFVVLYWKFCLLPTGQM
jgi:hypothetical protein